MEIRSVWLSELATCLPGEQEEPLLRFLCFTVLRYVYISEQYSTSRSVDRSSCSGLYISSTYGLGILNYKQHVFWGFCFGLVLISSLYLRDQLLVWTASFRIWGWVGVHLEWSFWVCLLRKVYMTWSHSVNNTDTQWLLWFKVVWELALKPRCYYKPGPWDPCSLESWVEKMGWFPVIEHMEERVLLLLEEQMFFLYLQCFSNPLEYRQTETCLLSLWFFFLPWICFGATFRWQGRICEILSGLCTQCLC